MDYALTWLETVLLDAGLKVAPTEGWRRRGRREMGRVDGVICHHTATTAKGNMPTLGTLIKGRVDVSGPLAQLGLARDGTFYLIAAGAANHAGAGDGLYRTISGNTHYIGIEAENPLPYSATWPDIQMDAYRRGVAAILSHLDLGAGACIAHKEYAPSRKPIDPAFDMREFRLAVAAIMEGRTEIRPQIPAVDPVTNRPTLRRGMTGDRVGDLQQALGLTVDREFGARTEATVRAFQRQHGMVPDGIVGPRTWKALERG